MQPTCSRASKRSASNRKGPVMHGDNENLLTETIATLRQSGKEPSDVRFVVAIAPKGDTQVCGSWQDFAALSDFTYDAGYGGNKINMSLKIVGDGWWLERGEYDGSEWWEFKTIPTKPDNFSPMRREDLKDRYS